MRRIFADNVYWVARSNPRDQWAGAAKEATRRLGNAIIVTTDEILTEFLDTMSGYGERIREAAVNTVVDLMNRPNIVVVPQSRKTFIAGLEFYHDRPDKAYSLVDCISMVTMKKEGITEVLTADHHFSQEGFNVLLK